MHINDTLTWYAAVLAVVLLTAALAAQASDLPRTVVWHVALKAQPNAGTYSGAVSPVPYPSAEQADSVVVTSDRNLVRIDGKGSIVFNCDLGDRIESMAGCGDVDGDGQAEIVGGTVRGHLVCLSGEGKVKWTCEARHPFTDWACAVISARRRGVADILIKGSDGWLTCVDGKGHFRWSFRVAVGGEISSPAVADLNGDGEPEYVAGIQGGILAITSEGRLMWQYASQEEFARQVAVVADADRDDTPEVYMLMNGATSAVYCLDGPTGKLRWRFPIPAKCYCALLVADINGDGYGEILAGTKYNDVIAISRSGQQLWKTTLGGTGMFYTPVVADVDGDGRLEIVVSVRAADIQGNSLFVLDTAGKVLGSYPQGGQGNSARVVADFDHDGLLEVVSSSADTVWAYRFGNPMKAGAALWPCFRATAEQTGCQLPMKAVKVAAHRPPAVPKGQLLPKTFDAVLGDTRITATWNSASPVLTYVEVAVTNPDGKRSTQYFAPKAGQNSAEVVVTFSHSGRYGIEARLVDGETGRALLEDAREIAYVPLATERRMLAAALESTSGKAASLAAAAPQIGAELDRRRATLMAKLESLQTRVKAVPADAEFPLEVIAAAEALRGQIAREESFAALACEVAVSSPQMLFGVWQDPHPWDCVDPRDELPAQAADKVEYAAWAYGNQKEDFCWSLIGFNPDPFSVRVEPGDLVGPAGAKEPWEKHLSLMQVEWMPSVHQPAQVPDMLPLMNTGRTLQLAPGSFAQVWMVLDTKGLAAGKWTVPLHFQSLTMAAAAVDVTLTAEVLPIELPFPYPWKMCNWASPANFHEPLRSIAIEDLISHGSNVFYAPIPVRACDAEGRLVGTADWSELDSLVADVKPVTPFLWFSSLPLTALAGMSQDSPAYKQAYKAWMQEFVAHLASIGITYRDFAFYPVDEPGNAGHTGIEQLIAAAKKLREADPQAPIYADPAGGAYPVEWIKELDPWVDVWQPASQLSSRKDLHEIMATRGRQIWIYNGPVDVRTMDAFGFYRRQPWVALRDGASGSGIWVYSYSDPWGNMWGVGPHEPNYGTAAVERTRVVETRRWRAAHDGVQDATGVVLLDNAIADAERAGVAQALVDEAKRVRSAAVLAIAGPPGAPDTEAQVSFDGWQHQRRLIADATFELRNAIAAKRG